MQTSCGGKYIKAFEDAIKLAYNRDVPDTFSDEKEQHLKDILPDYHRYYQAIDGAIDTVLTLNSPDTDSDSSPVNILQA